MNGDLEMIWKDMNDLLFRHLARGAKETVNTW
jgi:hypothetical protein